MVLPSTSFLAHIKSSHERIRTLESRNTDLVLVLNDAGVPVVHGDIVELSITVDEAVELCTGPIPGIGGAGTPGGDDKDVQFNDGAAFGGEDSFEFDKTAIQATLTGAFNARWEGLVLRNTNVGNTAMAEFFAATGVQALGLRIGLNGENRTLGGGGGYGPDYAYLWQELNAPIVFGTNDTTRMVITAGGSVLFQLHAEDVLTGEGLLQIGTLAGGTTKADGILLYPDANLYRSAANVLKTDDSLVITGQLTILGGSPLANKALVSDAAGLGSWEYAYGKAFVQDAEPGVMWAGQIWMDTPPDDLKIRNAANTAWITISGGAGEANTASNTGTLGTGLFKQKTGVDLEFYKLASANNLLTIALEGTDYLKFTVNEGNIDHDALTNFAANEHVVLPGTIAVVLSDHNLAAHTGLGLFDESSDVDHDQTTNFVAAEHIDWTNTTESLVTTGDATVDDLILADGGEVGIPANERIVFDAAGYIEMLGANVGIGVSDPDVKLEIMNSASYQLKLSFDAVDFALMGVDTNKNLSIIVGADAIVKLGDSLGAKFFRIQDSASALRFSVDSDGNTNVYGTHTVWGAVLDKYGAEIQRDLLVTLGDAAGAFKLTVANSADVPVATIDSYGNVVARSLDIGGGESTFDAGVVMWDTLNVALGATIETQLSVKLGDALGVSRVTIYDSGPVLVADLDSNGELWLAGGAIIDGGLRLRGADTTNELADFSVDATSNLIISTVASNDSEGFIDLRSKDNEFGIIIRESDGTGTGAYANLYVIDATSDYLNIIVDGNGTVVTTGLVVQANGYVGLGCLPLYRFHLYGIQGGEVPNTLAVEKSAADAYGAIIRLMSSRAGRTASVDGDAVGDIRWNGMDSTPNYQDIADIRVFIDDVTAGTVDATMHFRAKGAGAYNATSDLMINKALVTISGSNTTGLRLRGTDTVNQIADFFVSAEGNLVLDTTAGNETQGYIDLKSKDDVYGIIIRESDGTHTNPFANLYVTDDTINRLNIIVDGIKTADSLSLILQADGFLGLGRLPLYRFHLSGTSAYGSSMGFERASDSVWGPYMRFQKSRASGAANQDNDELGQVLWAGMNSTPGYTDVADIRVLMTDVTAATEDGEMRFRVKGAGTYSALNELLIVREAVTVNYALNLARGGVSYAIAGYVPLAVPLTSTSFDGDYYYQGSDDFIIDLSTSFGCPAGIKAIHAELIIQSANIGMEVGIGPSSTYWYHLTARTQVANQLIVNHGICACDANGDVYFHTPATTNTAVHIRIMGYWV